MVLYKSLDCGWNQRPCGTRQARHHPKLQSGIAGARRRFQVKKVTRSLAKVNNVATKTAILASRRVFPHAKSFIVQKRRMKLHSMSFIGLGIHEHI